MLVIQQLATPQQRAIVLDLFREYLDWNQRELHRHYGIDWDVQATLEHDRAALDQYRPPTGRLLLASLDGQPVGVLAMKVHTDGAAELKRMYVRPARRRGGIGRALVTRIIEDAQREGRRVIRLDSAGYMHDAHRLYRSVGFQDTEPYAESEIPAHLQAHWVFMAFTVDAPGTAATSD